MSDRGRSRRTARSTKATAPKATPDTVVGPGDEPASIEGAESDKTPAGAAVTAGTTPEAGTGPDETVPLDDTVEASGAADRDATGEPDGTAAADTSDVAAEADDAAEADTGVDDADEAGEPDASADDEDLEPVDPDEDKPATGRAKTDRSKAATPMTKAEKRAAARIAAAKSARRRRTGQAIAGTIIVLLVVGGAFAGIWYFGDRAEKNRVKCKPPADAAAFPPLLGGMDKALATEPVLTPGSADIKKVTPVILVKGDCKTVKAGQTVSVNYVGATIKDAKIFDSSWTRKKPIEIPVGQKKIGKQPQVIEGWDEGLVNLKVGTRIQLDIPGSMAYGDDAPEGYPAGTLRFIIDILDVKDTDTTGAGLGG